MIRPSRPSFITGLGITKCGYCGSAIILKSDKRTSKRAGKYYKRAISCSGASKGYTKCTGDMSPAQHLEHVLIDYCNEQLDLGTVFVDDDSKRQQLINEQAY
nr:zinc ribbon domain-containing protein [Moritella viscosa]